MKRLFVYLGGVPHSLVPGSAFGILRDMLQRFPPLRLRAAWGMVLLAALLLAQGVRVCLHVPHDAPAQPYAALHLESEFSSLGEHNDSAADQHYSLFGILKKLPGDIPLALFVALALALRASARSPRPAAAGLTPPAAGVYRWRPPLRAPPY